MIAFIYPGQGSQYEGMGEDFYKSFLEFRRVYERGCDVLKYDIRDLEQQKVLSDTRYLQSNVLLMSLGILKILEVEGFYADICAGHSLGELTAYMSSGVFCFEDGIRVLDERGRCMSKATKGISGGMVAIMGLEDILVEQLCQQEGIRGLVFPANYNYSGQVVVSGSSDGLERVLEVALSMGAKKAVQLKVAGAFHSPFMKDAALEFGEFLESIRIKEFRIPVIGNTKAEPVEIREVKQGLMNHLLEPVLWKKSIEKMVALGVRIFIELGAGKVLQGLVRKVLIHRKEVRVMGIGQVDDLPKVLKVLSEDYKL